MAKSAGWGLSDCFSPNDISGLRRPKKVKFGTKMASSTKISSAFRFLEKTFNYCKICKEKLAKIGQKRQKWPHCSPHATSETKDSRYTEIGTNIAHGMMIMPKSFVFELCTALVFHCGKNFSPKPANSKNANFSTRTVTPRIRTNSVQVSEFSTRYLRQCGALRTLWR